MEEFRGCVSCREGLMVFNDDVLCYVTIPLRFCYIFGVVLEKGNLVGGHGLPLGIWEIVNIFGLLFSVSAETRWKKRSTLL